MDAPSVERRKSWTVVAAAAVLLFTAAAFGPADEFRLSGKDMFERSVCQGLQLSGDETRLQLERGVTYQDDGPASGYSYQPNLEKLGAGIRIKKQFLLDGIGTDSALLLVCPGGDLDVEVNGTPCPLTFLGKRGHSWQAYKLPTEHLRRGVNDLVLWGEGKVYIARDDEFAAGAEVGATPPNRSAKSTDGGARWDDQRLGIDGDVDGEYSVRLFLDQHRSQGRLRSPVVDVGNLGGRTVGVPVDSLGVVDVELDAFARNWGRVALRCRSGTTFVPGPATWTDWRSIDTPRGSIEPAGRFLQVEVELSTTDPAVSPEVRELRIRCEPLRSGNWTDGIRVDRATNEPLVRTSIPFEYEPMDRPELGRLRQEYDLDAVVEGAASEFELIQRLAVWSSGRWQRGHLKDAYPAWNALAILEPAGDGTPVGGFCLHYNLVFLQACESFGLTGRVLSIGPGDETARYRGGHEVVEIWSDDFGKWIYVDGQTAWILVDADSQIPLSIWELRQRQLSAIAGREHRPVERVALKPDAREWEGLLHWPPFVESRLIGRSDFLARRAPLPLNQGMHDWSWTGHQVWTDERMPARPIYTNRVHRRGDFEWSVNRCHLVLEATAAPGTIRVHVDTATPGLEGLSATIDEGAPATVERVFEWKLHAGRNRLAVAGRNQLGRSFTPAAVELDYAPARPPAGTDAPPLR